MVITTRHRHREPRRVHREVTSTGHPATWRITESFTWAGQRIVVDMVAAREVYDRAPEVINENLDREIDRHVRLPADPALRAVQGMRNDMLLIDETLHQQPVEVAAPAGVPGLTLADVQQAADRVRREATGDWLRQMVDANIAEWARPMAGEYFAALTTGNTYARGNWTAGPAVDIPAQNIFWTTTNATEATVPFVHPPLRADKPKLDCACGEPQDRGWLHEHDECTFLDRPSSEWQDDGPVNREDDDD